MSETPATYNSGFFALTAAQVEAERRSAYAYAFPAPSALLSPARLAALADALAEERQGCDSEPASPLGFWPTAVAELLGHAEAQAGRVKEEQAAAAEAEREKLAAYEALRKVRGEIKWMAGALESRRPDDFTSITAGQLAGKVRTDLLALLANETPSEPVPAGFPGGNAAGYEAIRQQMAQRCAKCKGVVNAYGQCFYCDTTEAGLCN